MAAIMGDLTTPPTNTYSHVHGISIACEDCGREWESVCIEVIVNYFIDDLVCKRDLPWQPLVVTIFKPKGAIGVPRSGQLSRTATLSCVVPPHRTNYTWQVNHTGKGLKAGSGCLIHPVIPNDAQSPVMQDAQATGDKTSNHLSSRPSVFAESGTSHPVHNPLSTGVQMQQNTFFIPGHKNVLTVEPAGFLYNSGDKSSASEFYPRDLSSLNIISDEGTVNEGGREIDVNVPTTSRIFASQKKKEVMPKRTKTVQSNLLVQLARQKSSVGTSTSEAGKTPSKHQNPKTSNSQIQNLDDQAVEKIVVVPDICVRSDLFEVKKSDAGNVYDPNIAIKEEQIEVHTGIITDDEDNESLMSDDIVILENEPSPECDIITLDDMDHESREESVSPETNILPKTNERASVLHFAKQPTLHNLPAISCPPVAEQSVNYPSAYHPSKTHPITDYLSKYPVHVNPVPVSTGKELYSRDVSNTRDMSNTNTMQSVVLQSIFPADPSARNTSANLKDNRCYTIAKFRNIIKNKVAEHYMHAGSSSGHIAQDSPSGGKSSKMKVFKRTIKEVDDSDDQPNKKLCETSVNQLLVHTPPGEFGDPLEDGRMFDAVEAVQSGTSIATAARNYGIKQDQLRKHVKSAMTACQDEGITFAQPKGLISQKDEHAIVQWVTTVTNCGFTVTKKDIALQIKKVLRGTGLVNMKDNIIPREWIRKFIQRYPEIKPYVMDTNSDTISTSLEECVTQWFNKFAFYFHEASQMYIGNLLNKNSSSRVFNAEEMFVFFRDSDTLHNRIVLKSERGMQTKDGSLQKVVTVLVCCNANGLYLKPLIISPNETQKKTNKDEVSEASEACYNTRYSQSGFVDPSLFVKWLKTFNDTLVKESIQKPVVLLLNGSKVNYVTAPICKWANSNGIIIFGIPHKLSSVLAPLEVGVIGLLKSEYLRSVRSFDSPSKSDAGSFINFKYFPSIFMSVWNKVATATNAKKGFKETGILPRNNTAINNEKLAKLKPKISRSSKANIPDKQKELQDRLNSAVESVMNGMDRKEAAALYEINYDILSDKLNKEFGDPWAKGRYTEAIEAIQSGMDISEATEKFLVKKTQLCSVINMSNPFYSKGYPSLNMGFVKVNERGMIKWIMGMNKKGFVISKYQVRANVKHFVESSSQKDISSLVFDKVATNQWMTKFIKKHHQLTLLYIEPEKLDMADNDRERINIWYSELEEHLKEEELDPEEFFSWDNMHRVFNACEIGIPLGSCSDLDKNNMLKRVRTIQKRDPPENTVISVMICCSAAGLYQKPMIVYPSKVGPSPHWNRPEEIDESSFNVQCNDYGCMDPYLFSIWLKGFNETLIQSDIQKPVLLLLEGDTSLDYNSCELARSMGIMLHGIIPKAAPILLPMGISYLGQLNAVYAKQMEKISDTIDSSGEGNIISNFPYLFMQGFKEISTTVNAIYGFRATGILPRNNFAISDHALDIISDGKDTQVSSTSYSSASGTPSVLQKDDITHGEPWEDGRMRDAVSAVQNGTRLLKAARKFRISKNTLKEVITSLTFLESYKYTKECLSDTTKCHIVQDDHTPIDNDHDENIMVSKSKDQAENTDTIGSANSLEKNDSNLSNVAQALSGEYKEDKQNESPVGNIASNDKGISKREDEKDLGADDSDENIDVLTCNEDASNDDASNEDASNEDAMFEKYFSNNNSATEGVVASAWRFEVEHSRSHVVRPTIQQAKNTEKQASAGIESKTVSENHGNRLDVPEKQLHTEDSMGGKDKLVSSNKGQLSSSSGTLLSSNKDVLSTDKEGALSADKGVMLPSNKEDLLSSNKEQKLKKSKGLMDVSVKSQNKFDRTDTLKEPSNIDHEKASKQIDITQGNKSAPPESSSITEDKKSALIIGSRKDVVTIAKEKSVPNISGAEEVINYSQTVETASLEKKGPVSANDSFNMKKSKAQYMKKPSRLSRSTAKKEIINEIKGVDELDIESGCLNEITNVKETDVQAGDLKEVTDVDNATFNSGDLNVPSKIKDDTGAVSQGNIISNKRGRRSLKKIEICEKQEEKTSSKLTKFKSDKSGIDNSMSESCGSSIEDSALTKEPMCTKSDALVDEILNPMVAIMSPTEVPKNLDIGSSISSSTKLISEDSNSIKFDVKTTSKDEFQSENIKSKRGRPSKTLVKDDISHSTSIDQIPKTTSKAKTPQTASKVELTRENSSPKKGRPSSKKLAKDDTPQTILKGDKQSLDKSMSESTESRKENSALRKEQIRTKSSDTLFDEMLNPVSASILPTEESNNTNIGSDMPTSTKLKSEDTNSIKNDITTSKDEYQSENIKPKRGRPSKTLAKDVTSPTTSLDDTPKTISKGKTPKTAAKGDVKLENTKPKKGRPTSEILATKDSRKTMLKGDKPSIDNSISESSESRIENSPVRNKKIRPKSSDTLFDEMLNPVSASILPTEESNNSDIGSDIPSSTKLKSEDSNIIELDLKTPSKDEFRSENIKPKRSRSSKTPPKDDTILTISMDDTPKITSKDETPKITSKDDTPKITLKDETPKTAQKSELVTENTQPKKGRPSSKELAKDDSPKTILKGDKLSLDKSMSVSTESRKEKSARRKEQIRTKSSDILFEEMLNPVSASILPTEVSNNSDIGSNMPTSTKLKSKDLNSIELDINTTSKDGFRSENIKPKQSRPSKILAKDDTILAISMDETPKTTSKDETPKTVQLGELFIEDIKPKKGRPSSKKLAKDDSPKTILKGDKQSLDKSMSESTESRKENSARRKEQIRTKSSDTLFEEMLNPVSASILPTEESNNSDIGSDMPTGTKLKPEDTNFIELDLKTTSKDEFRSENIKPKRSHPSKTLSIDSTSHTTLIDDTTKTTAKEDAPKTAQKGELIIENVSRTKGRPSSKKLAMDDAPKTILKRDESSIDKSMSESNESRIENSPLRKKQICAKSDIHFDEMILNPVGATNFPTEVSKNTDIGRNMPSKTNLESGDSNSIKCDINTTSKNESSIDISMSESSESRIENSPPRKEQVRAKSDILFDEMILNPIGGKILTTKGLINNMPSGTNLESEDSNSIKIDLKTTSEGELQSKNVKSKRGRPSRTLAKNDTSHTTLMEDTPNTNSKGDAHKTAPKEELKVKSPKKGSSSKLLSMVNTNDEKNLDNVCKDLKNEEIKPNNDDDSKEIVKPKRGRSTSKKPKLDDSTNVKNFENQKEILNASIDSETLKKENETVKPKNRKENDDKLKEVMKGIAVKEVSVTEIEEMSTSNTINVDPITKKAKRPYKRKVPKSIENEGNTSNTESPPIDCKPVKEVSGIEIEEMSTSNTTNVEPITKKAKRPYKRKVPKSIENEGNTSNTESPPIDGEPVKEVSGIEIEEMSTSNTTNVDPMTKKAKRPYKRKVPKSFENEGNTSITESPIDGKPVKEVSGIEIEEMSTSNTTNVDPITKKAKRPYKRKVPKSIENEYNTSNTESPPIDGKTQSKKKKTALSPTKNKKPTKTDAPSASGKTVKKITSKKVGVSNKVGGQKFTKIKEKLSKGKNGGRVTKGKRQLTVLPAPEASTLSVDTVSHEASTCIVDTVSHTEPLAQLPIQEDAPHSIIDSVSEPEPTPEYSQSAEPSSQSPEPSLQSPEPSLQSPEPSQQSPDVPQVSREAIMRYLGLLK